MPDTEGYIPIVNGTTTIVGGLALLTGTIPSGPGAGNSIFAQEVAIRNNSTLVSSSNPFPVQDSVSETALSTIATNTNGVATATLQNNGNSFLSTIATNTTALSTSALQVSGNSSLTTVANAQGAGGSGITQPTGGSGILGWLSGIFSAVTNILFTKPGSYTQVPLDNNIIVNAGTAASILYNGHCTAGGYLVFQSAVNVSQIGNAGTVVGGNNVPVLAGATYEIIPTIGSVSAIGTTGSIIVSGYGLQ